MKISIKTIIEEMPKDLTDIEKLRYAYLRCGQILSYDRDYLYDKINDNNGYEKYNKETNIFDLKIENSDNKIKGTCKQMSDIYVQTVNNIFGKEIAKEIGYNEEEQDHVAVVAKLHGSYYFMDLYSDIYRIQKGFTTKYFAPSQKDLKKHRKRYYSIDKNLNRVKYETIPQKEMKKMDEKLGYVKFDMYMDDAIEKLREEMQDKESWKAYIEDYEKIKKKNKKDVISRWKIDFIFRYIKNNIKDEDKLEEIEIEKYIKKIYYSILTREEIKKNKLNTIHIHYNKKPSVLFKVDNKKGKSYYIYNDDEKGFNKVSYDELIEMKNKKELTYDLILRKTPNDEEFR